MSGFSIRNPYFVVVVSLIAAYIHILTCVHTSTQSHQHSSLSLSLTVNVCVS